MSSYFDRVQFGITVSPPKTPLAGLVQQVEAIESRHRPDQSAAGGALLLGWARPRLRHGDEPRPPAPGADHLRWGCLHEWFCEEQDGAPALLLHIARRAMRQRAGAADAAGVRPIIWISPHRRTYPPALAPLLPMVVWVQSPDRRARLWSIDLALRCRGVSAVIADGVGLEMAASRRLQLAAETGGTLGLLYRPMRDRSMLSVAATRWMVRPSPSPTSHPRWSVELLRCKGAQPDREAPRCFTVEWDHVQGDLVVPDQLADRSGAAAGATARVLAAG